MTSVLGEVLLRQAGASVILGLGGDGAAIASAMAANQDAFRAGFALSLVSLGVYVALMGLLYRVLAPADRTIARIALVFSIIALTLQAFAAVSQLAAFGVATSGRTVVGESQVASVVLLLLRGYGQAYSVALVMWGWFWLLVAFLVFWSPFMPRPLSVAPALAGLSWLLLLWPPLSAGLPVQILGGLGEVVFVLRLLIRGVNEDRWRTALQSDAART